MTKQLEGIPLSVRRARLAVQAFEETEGGKYNSAYKDDMESLLNDILTDLYHWADSNRLDYAYIEGVARRNHDAEVEDSKDGD